MHSRQPFCGLNGTCFYQVVKYGKLFVVLEAVSHSRPPISGAGLLEWSCEVASWLTNRVVIAPGPLALLVVGLPGLVWVRTRIPPDSNSAGHNLPPDDPSCEIVGPNLLVPGTF